MNILNQPPHTAALSANYQSEIKQSLSSGQVIVYPTDTLYGLGVDAYSKEAVEKLYHLKGRKDSPVSVLLESAEQLVQHAVGLSDKARDLIHTFLPGALTVICKSQKPYAEQIISRQGTIGFRVPGDLLSTQLPQILGRPITTTSVNPPGLPPATRRSEVLEYFGDQPALMLDIGPLNPSKGSTVIDVSCSPFKILREGEISRQSLQDYLN